MPDVPRSMAITDGRGRPPAELGRWVEHLAAAGVEAIQVREKAVTDRRLLELVETAVDAAAGALRVLVNGRYDLACAAGADGVHLPSNGVPTAATRAVAGEMVLLGRSTHASAEVERTAGRGADYVTFGPIYRSPAKLRYGQPQGLDALREACTASLPVLAIGGVRPDRLAALADAGAWGVAAIRMFQASPAELARTVAAVREAFAA